MAPGVSRAILLCRAPRGCLNGVMCLFAVGATSAHFSLQKIGRSAGESVGNICVCLVSCDHVCGDLPFEGTERGRGGQRAQSESARIVGALVHNLEASLPALADWRRILPAAAGRRSAGSKKSATFETPRARERFKESARLRCVCTLQSLPASRLALPRRACRSAVAGRNKRAVA